MSFRRKLSLFFVAIVMVPLVVVGVLLIQVTQDARDGKADARVAAGLTVAGSLYDAALKTAPAEADRIARIAGPALEDADRATLQDVAEEALSDGVASITFRSPSGEVLATAGDEAGLAGAETDIGTMDGRAVGSVEVTTLRPDEFLDQVNRLTTEEVALASRVDTSSTIGLEGTEVPAIGDEDGATLELGPNDREFRTAALALDGGPPGARIALIVPRESGFAASEPLVAGVLAVLFAIALLLIALLLRNLQRRVATMLEAARRIGNGEFDQTVPVEGNDEMAGLALEFNKMSERLGDQVSQLKRQSVELDESVKRIGEAFASGLDRDALLEIMLETATAACAADGGRVVLHDALEEPGVMATEGLPQAFVGALTEADAVAAESLGVGEASRDGRYAISRAMVSRDEGRKVLCTLAVVRDSKPFTRDEREVLRYLIGQTQISIENIGLHDRVAGQAVTDELTGLANHRHFSDWLEREVARVDRFGGVLSLIILDIDDFKKVNDTHGHLQGDRVLQALGRTLKRESREVDESARYGGEEFVLALPETAGIDAIELAERLRQRIAEIRIDGENGDSPISVTASLGIATFPYDGNSARPLIAAADAALYEAKRMGKNRVVSAVGVRKPAPQGIEEGQRS